MPEEDLKHSNSLKLSLSDPRCSFSEISSHCQTGKADDLAGEAALPQQWVNGPYDD